MQEPPDPAESPEVGALAALPRERRPRPELEEVVASALRSRELLRPKSPRPPARWHRVAAAALWLLVGVAAGRWLELPDSADADPTPRFLLLLYEDADAAPLSPKEEKLHFTENAKWARELHEANRLIAADPLGPQERVLGPPLSQGPETLGGYFLIRADNLEEATAIAEASPHLRHRGTVVVRPLGGESSG